ncbi:MAG: peptidoglycan DD-metalloendopeptidase family protein [Armatimonadota bacterium]|nr:peptidoglycan DD-metalloendopeptidase family protein [Armatimonadota bacterium]MDR5675023.1 peptidoglycan DD-metalloendopeptidase family protein [Armatimonadota bacterium]MDR5689083.1 peptidoglycan DD-metalloendopeptidase family protein [Armatimonadota bacterium]MDR7389626.1 peptidoglycan DD-metalloendopeptidase family protein [Armatimonadota bacterium]MDR7390574.1 peptidoglycan DD-metalloendopeptidase family protein [Armatimonadota bacterium]
MNLRVVPLLLLAAAVLLPSGGAHAGPYQDRRRELERVRQQLQRTRQELRQARRYERSVLGELQRIEQTREQLEHELRALEGRLRTVRARESLSRVREAASRKRLDSLQSRLEERLRAIHRRGRAGYVDVLLASADFPTFLTRLDFLGRLVRQDAELVRQTEEERRRWEALRDQLARERAEVEQVRTDVAERRRLVAEEEARKRALLARVQKERAAYEQLVEELEEDSRRLEALLQRLAPVGGTGSGPRWRLGFGLAWPARGAITSGFGLRRHPLFGIVRPHHGVDIAAPWGTPVRAAGGGTVVYAGWFGGYGKLVVVDHGGGVATLYGHLSSILVSLGQRVGEGDLVGRVGSTGYSTGPHLHFEIRVNGRPVDPLR